MKLKNIIKADFYTFLHSPLWIIHVLVPALGMGVFIWYYSFSAMNRANQIMTYSQVLACTYPFLIGIVTAFISEMEQRAGGCQLLLMTPGPKWKMHIGKWMVLLFWGLLATGIACAGFGVLIRMEGNMVLPFSAYAVMALLVWVSAWPIYFMSYAVSFFLGKSYGIGMGVAGSLLSALMLTGIGDSCWIFQPWGIIARLMPTFVSNHIDHIPFLQYNNVYKAIIILFLLVIVLAGMTVVGLEKWEGRKNDD